MVELSDSDTDEEILTSQDDLDSEDDCVTDEVTIDNIKFPKQKGEKGKIEILDSKVNWVNPYYFMYKTKTPQPEKPHIVFSYFKTWPLKIPCFSK